MTHIFDDPHTFTDDMLVGFLDVHRERVVGVPGGVVRATQTPTGKVAVVVGGGSGHYPAFCGVVGSGFADGAVVGNIFTSPSTADAYSVGRAAASDAGLLLITGNYAGDVMNFTRAQERLTRDHIETRVVFVTDDIASAPVNETAKRRGIAGDFVVFKVAGAAAEEGMDLDDVERVARHANDRTRTLGVAFGGCTMPGAGAPLFSVPEGHMGVGLGIHGEPGVEDAPLASATDLARRLVEGVLQERPSRDPSRVGAILNGLGTTKYEELFVLWSRVATLFTAAGIEVVEPEVGELVTSLDMSGCSLTLVFLDDELERLWRAPADTPAFRKGAASITTAAPRRSASAVTDDLITAAPSTEASRRCAAVVVSALEEMCAAVVNAEDELGRIDAVAGDGDHGRGMVKGVAAAVTAARSAAGAGAGAGSTLVAAGDAFADRAGGTSGVLWGAVLGAIGTRWGDTDAPSDSAVAEGVAAGLETLRQLGGASVGDKTMVDAYVPFSETLTSETRSGAHLSSAWSAAAHTSAAAAEATASLTPKLGRARPLAARSVGSVDAGATSFALCAQAVAKVLGSRR
jgi:dihydroxyacetone kinase